MAMLGHKADLGVMALGPDLARLQAFQAELLGAPLDPVWSYVSLTELSEYGATEDEERARLVAEEDLAGNELEQRLADVARAHRALPRAAHPSEPARRSRCAASTRCRSGAPPDANWFELSFEQRKELMSGHARVGRTYAGRVLQLITGSTGIDDWEWGVTLLADDVVALKEIVYEMRFDPVSARYADFGPFFTGLVLPPPTRARGSGCVRHERRRRDPAVRLLPRGAGRTGPMIYELVKQFDVIPNLRRANVESHSGWVILELSGRAGRTGRGDRVSRGPGLHREPHGRRRRRRVDQPSGAFVG